MKPLLANQKEEKDREYWLEVDATQKQEVLKHIKKYSLRKKITFEDISNTISVAHINLSSKFSQP